MRVYRFAAAAAICLVIATDASARTRDHLSCYKSKSEFAGVTANLDDDFNPDAPGGSNTFFVKKVKNYCIPASAVSAGLNLDHSILDPNDVATFYAAKRAAGECSGNAAIACKGDDECTGNGTCTVYPGKFDKKAARNVSRQVVDLSLNYNTRLNFGKEIGVIAPGRVGGSAPAAGTEDFYKCYSAKAAKAVCNGGANHGNACKEDFECPSGTCFTLPKFPKEVYSNGSVGAEIDDAFLPSGVVDLFSKLKMVCQVASNNGAATVHPGAGYMCYSAKQSSGPDFSPVAPVTASTAYDDAAFYEVVKPEMVCNPACIAPPPLTDASFTNLVLKVTSLAIGANENAGEALDVDGDTTRDNVLAPLGVLANGAISDAIADESLILLFQLDALGNGNHIVSGYTAEKATPANCTNVNDAAQMCDYLVDESALQTSDACGVEAEIQLPVTISGSSAAGGGPGTVFSISFSLGDSGDELTVTAQNVKVDATFTQVAGPDVTAIAGVIGGAVPLADFMDALEGIGGECSPGSGNAGAECTASSECTGGGSCYLFGMITPEAVRSLIDFSINPDIDLDGVKNCIKGNNSGEECNTIDDCPDPDGGGVAACQQNESVSLGLKFQGIDANIVGVGD